VVLWPEFLATDPGVRIPFPALPDFLRSVGLERGPLSLVSITEALLGRKSSLRAENTAVGIRYADHVASSNRKSWH
jgi:hypothetical protein